MPNMQSIIAKHNKQIINRLPPDESNALPCNCRCKSSCPLNGKCREKCTIYKASVTTPNNTTMEYYGCCETDFKVRFYNHNQSFKNPSKRNQTELSKLVWSLKDANHNPVIKWSIVCKSKPYVCGAKQCQLCLAEKLSILQANPETLLNKRSRTHSEMSPQKQIQIGQNPTVIADSLALYVCALFSRFSHFTVVAIRHLSNNS